MPFEVNPGKLGRIEVSESEDGRNFLVRIHPENRDRAKKILGRQWDGNRKAWVYPKTPEVYEALAREFCPDADVFDIRKPITQRYPGSTPPEHHVNIDPLEELGSMEDASSSESIVSLELEQVQVMLSSLLNLTENQNDQLTQLYNLQNETAGKLSKLESIDRENLSPEPIEVLPAQLNFTDPKQLELIEKALVSLVIQSSANQKSLQEWFAKHKPLREPSAFVTQTHEFLKGQLGKIVGDENKQTNFSKLIDKANRGKFIYSDPSRPQEEPILILKCLNFHRNYFGHPDGIRTEAWKRSILYLLHLPFVWSTIVIDE
ncbi:hypothetical protein [Oscillatoria sp. FACHB-1406]|uniref:hypothetical protein n=1 Tax=Oscillatoria sp. FACHB-1406 TaxID=2692846 RepID=UPI001995C847|nr:hypothetical protein [Oscillatoria sp. FACHB-1406]MBD2577943.1 hypothetical protein [Oscillatoria sp. FACHB-1406]